MKIIRIPKRATAEECAEIIANSLRSSGYAYPWDIAERIQARLPRPAPLPRLCMRCGAARPADQSCGCFDNHCE